MKFKKIFFPFSKPKFTTGFTIIEIIIVIGIIAILTVIIFPAINNIRAKNRDAERISDIAAIQLGLLLYYNQNSTIGYPANLEALVPAYVPNDSIISPNSGDSEYLYVPLKREGSKSDKCTFYHLGIFLETPSAQIDTGNIFNSADLGETGYEYCGENEEGFDGGEYLMYQVRP